MDAEMTHHDTQFEQNSGFVLPRSVFLPSNTLRTLDLSSDTTAMYYRKNTQTDCDKLNGKITTKFKTRWFYTEESENEARLGNHLNQ